MTVLNSRLSDLWEIGVLLLDPKGIVGISGSTYKAAGLPDYAIYKQQKDILARDNQEHRQQDKRD